MTTVDLAQSKEQFDQILARVAQGEEFTITDAGRPVAVLKPATEEPARMDAVEAVRAIKELRRGLSRGGLSIREMVEEGRRF